MRWVLQVSFFLASATSALAVDLPFTPRAVMSGVAVAHDGDDIKFGSVQVRLIGVAAPEYNRNNREPGGRESYEALAALVDGQVVTCYLDGSTAGRYRPAALCFVGDQDLGRAQVLAGAARDCPSFSHGVYAEDEQEARRTGQNLSEIYALPNYCLTAE